MSLEAIKLRFSTPVHLGRGLEDLDRSETVYHSDSLKSAIFAVGLAQFPHWAEDNADAFFNGFRISSCFPFSGDELFLPKPFLNIRFEFSEVANDRQAKTGKKVSFLSLKQFEKLISVGEGAEPIKISKDVITPDGQFICENETTAKRSFFKTEVQQRVSVFLEGNDEQTRPFYMDRLYFEKDCGLYFLVDFRGNTELRNQVLQTLRLLGDLGIGTDRTVGNGLFDFDQNRDVQSVEIKTVGKHQKQMNLGLYLPKEKELKEIKLDQSHWSLLKRGGYMGGTSNDEFLSLRKKSLYFFGEGSVFESETPLIGKKEYIKPDWNLPMHPVWRDGQCLFITI
jgi:CRISPR-associated protein Csm4